MKTKHKTKSAARRSVQRRVRAQFSGSRFSEPVRGITLGCISPEARDLLDRVMGKWKLHKAQLPKTIGGKRYSPGVYGFAYWLIRWSGLVRPNS